MSGKYSKAKLVSKRWIAVLTLLFIILLVASISFIIFINVKNSIVYENIKNNSSTVDDNIATRSTPIVVNNIVLGAVYNHQWVSMEKYFFKSTNKKSSDVDVFTQRGKTGSFKLNDVEKGANQTAAYTSTTRTNYTDEYFAAASGSVNMTRMEALKLTDSDIALYKSKVKSALGLYGILNGTVKIKEVYEVSLIQGEISYVITATNDGKTNQGVYSTVIFVDNLGKSRIIKYNYIKNVNKASNFSIYTVKFVSDLNSDGICEVIMQETKEFNTKYSVMEYDNGKFYEVLSASINS